MLSSILSQESCLSEIKDRTFALSKLSHVINELLPSPLKQQCRVANYRQGVLVLEVSSASWLTRLKYEQSNLISEIRKNILPSLSSIQYRINPNISVTLSQCHFNVSKLPLGSSLMTEKSAMFLYELAENAPDKLKKQLIKLANHAK
ncbi:DUF721 domain-containing protein [Gilliamella sp. Pra-s65]|uniref:DUF721 domain-containing protein n=1 Tax=unclassified Gilliamella TaxID=2685620 RepID=UPI0013268BE5|nr:MULTISPECIES: DciA family protein [unclassified Gilliamella]MWN31517.1 DUF721 domain-containing protein [Gilliamella sp. Pra-s60]MWN89727.1 DUF721 domain-containing protein [Gilliamella sp. Pra-s65]MWP28624.1 DUF721 domain-containing protein [Gilliamella sp. Pra-s54]MWP47252.1 DUF721 domain-containing protein [Gilliamella sp. Pas-s27]MWP72735.1 DUF721 domain-containing protein [Gilliamella sp. Pra-s52]